MTAHEQQSEVPEDAIADTHEDHVSWADRARRTDLVRALKEVAWAPMAVVFRDLEDLDREEYAVLVEALKCLEPDKWKDSDHGSALKVSVHRALMLLPDDEGPPLSTMSWRKIGLTLYGFENREAARKVVKPKTRDRRRQVVRDSAKHMSEAEFKRDVLDEFYPKLADAFTVAVQ